MQLGILTAPFPDTPLMDGADWAVASGFEALEIACWPEAAGPARRYAGTSHVDVADASAEQLREIADELSQKGSSISPLGQSVSCRL